MPRSHPAYPAEYRQRLVEMVRSGRGFESLAVHQRFQRVTGSPEPSADGGVAVLTRTRPLPPRSR